jgi:hypothetical protein
MLEICCARRLVPHLHRNPGPCIRSTLQSCSKCIRYSFLFRFCEKCGQELCTLVVRLHDFDFLLCTVTLQNSLCFGEARGCRVSASTHWRIPEQAVGLAVPLGFAFFQNISKSTRRTQAVLIDGLQEGRLCISGNVPALLSPGTVVLFCCIYCLSAISQVYRTRPYKL